MKRPIIFYYPGKGQFEMAANGHNFNGTIYTPNAQTRLNFDGPSKFTGTVYADTLALPSNHGQYVLKDYLVILLVRPVVAEAAPRPSNPGWWTTACGKKTSAE